MPDPNKQELYEDIDTIPDGEIPEEGEDVGKEVPDTDNPEAEAADTETETVVDASTTDTGTETVGAEEAEDEDELVRVMRETGLDKIYKDPAIALRAMQEKERYIAELRTRDRDRNALLERITTQRQERPERQPDLPQGEEFLNAFMENPEKALRERGFVSESEISPMLNQIQNQLADSKQQTYVSQFADVVGQHEGLEDVAKHIKSHGLGDDSLSNIRGVNPTWDAMNKALMDSPGLQGADHAALIPVLYNLVTSRSGSNGTNKTSVEKVSQDKKARASTTSGGHSGKAGSPKGERKIPTAEQFGKMSEQEIEKWYRENEMTTGDWV